MSSKIIVLITIRMHSGVNLIWNLGVVDPSKTNFDFSRHISEKIRVSSGNFTKHFDFLRQIFKKFRFFQAKFQKISIFSGNFQKIPIFQAKISLFTATSGQIILFLFKSHHFRTYFLHMIECNNISRPPEQNLGGRDPQALRIDAPAHACLQ